MIARAVALTLLILPCRLSGFPDGPSIDGTWTSVPARSTEIAAWKGRTLGLAISVRGDRVSIVHNWLDRGQVAYADTFRFVPGGKAVRSVVCSVEWPDNWLMGVLSSAGDERTVSGSWQVEGSDIRTVTVQPVVTSQGKTTVTTTREYVLGDGGNTLTLTERRSSRPTPVVLVFERKEVRP